MKVKQVQMAKPILFSTPMIHAIQREMNPKSQTRRVMKPQPVKDEQFAGGWKYGKGQHFVSLEWLNEEHELYDCPYGKPSDILWVRETWCNINKPECIPEYCYKDDADDAEDYDASEWTWRPSIFMPKEAARIFLRVKDARVERLQKMTLEAARAEGFDSIAGFMTLWNQLNTHRGYGWGENPWVWVIEFEKIAKPEGWPEAAV